MADVWDVVNEVLGKGRRILLYGPPGTGKTYSAARKNLLDGQQPKLVTLTEETPMTELRGHYTIAGGSMVWSHGTGIQAWLSGDRLVLNEINRASGDVLTFLYALLDDPDFANFTLPTGETVRPSASFCVVATMNGTPDELPEALQDRFAVSINVNKINPEIIKSFPKKYQQIVKETTKTIGAPNYISARSWYAYLELVTKGVPTRVAADVAFGSQSKDVVHTLTAAEA